jgi:hypothetical protein
VSWFARIEERCASFIEHAFASMFPSDLEPAQIARKLVATMEARSEQSDGSVCAPANYDVFVSTIDFARLSEHKAYLEQEWSALLADVAGRVGIRFEGGAPSVRLGGRDGLANGAIDIRVRDDAQSAPASFLLRVIKGVRFEEFRVTGAARVGRGSECDIALADPSVSRNHALLDVRRGVLFVRDANSTNGTFVNGTRVETAAVHAGDTIAFGKTELLVQVAS